VNGRKRHILVDTLGLPLSIVVHPADVQDRDGARRVLAPLAHTFSRLRKVWADSAYGGNLATWLSRLRWHNRVELELVEKPAGPGFVVSQHRWVVERTFGWTGRSRRLSKDYEATTSSAEAFLKISMIHLMVRRLVRIMAF
jgi:putative transposase